MGLIRVFLGIESSSEIGLRCLNRRQSVEDSVRALTLCEVSRRIFFERCWSYESLSYRCVGFDHLSATVRHFYLEDRVEALVDDIHKWVHAVNMDTLALLDETASVCKEAASRNDPELVRAVSALQVAKQASRAGFLLEYECLRRRMTAITDAALKSSSSSTARSSAARRVGAARHAGALLIACALGACDGRGFGVSEYAAPPLKDADGDGLPDQCEEEIFGTSPTKADSNDNGVPDGQEDHDGDGMTNLEEQTWYGDSYCGDATPYDAGAGEESDT